MTVKNNFKKQQKQIKKKKARKLKQAQQLHNATVNKTKPKYKKSEYSEEFIHNYIEEHGYARAIADLKLRADPEGFTNKETLQMISDSIPPIQGIHSAVETIEILMAEGKVELGETDKTTITEFDKIVVRFVEDVDTICVFVEQRHEPMAYADILLDFTNLVQTIFSDCYPILVGILEQHQTLIDEYAAEHGAKEDAFKFAEKLHTARMSRIFPLYKTKLADEENTVTDSNETIPA